MTPKVPDYGHREADKELFALIRRLHLSYRQASIGLHEKIEKYLDEFEKEDVMKRALYDSGEMSHEAFIKWRQKMITDTKAWRDMLEQLSDDMTHQNQIAASMIDDTLPGVYALNHNYGTYEAEVGSGYDTTYTLYDKNTVKRLLTEHEDLLPHPSVPVEKDKLWNKQHLQSAVLQGILTGEPMSDIAKRFQSVTDMTERAAMRNARTAVTGAENAGRIDSYIRAQNMGIKMKQMWMATLDSRTRDSHAIMDGEQQEVGKKFSNGCRYPGDPQGSPGEIWNCRCTTVAVVEGADPYNPNLRPSEYLKEKGLTYEQWKQMHGERFYSKLFENYEEPKNKIEIKIEFTPAKTKEEAEDYAKKFAKNVDYSRISVENCNAINKKLDELTTKYPINELEIIGGTTKGRAIMRAWYNGIDINRKAIGGSSLADEQNQFISLQESRKNKIEQIKGRYKNAIPKDMQKQINILENQLKFKRWSVFDSENPIGSTVTHEYGHIVADQYFGQINGSKANPNYDKNYELRKYVKKWDEVFLKAKKTGDIYNLSEYSATNAYEFFAESFTAKELGEKLPDYVSELLEEILNNGIM